MYVRKKLPPHYTFMLILFNIPGAEGGDLSGIGPSPSKSLRPADHSWR